MIEYLRTKLGIPKLDGTEQSNRRYAHLFIQKYKKEGIEPTKLFKEVVDIASNTSNWWYGKTTKVADIYYNTAKILASKHFNKSKVAVIN